MTKDIGVIADIHSNYTAFKTAVDYIESRGITDFLLLGDFVSDTTDTVETMQLLYSLIKKHNVTLLRGNREEYIIGQRKVLRGESDSPRWLYNSASGNLLYTFELLTDSDIDFFESLPITFKYECAGFPSITCCHGSPANVRELLQLDGENTREWLQRIDTDYLLAAHTHFQGEIISDGRHYFNTGSTGIAINTPGFAQCLILHGSDSSAPAGPSWKAEFLNLPYDVCHVVESIYDKGLMEKGKWFISNNVFTLMTGKDYTPELITTATELQEQATESPVQRPYIEEKYFAEAAKILGIPDYSDKNRFINERRLSYGTYPAFIWDLDGTLLDSYTVIVSGLYRLSKEYGFAAEKEEISKEVITYSVTHFLNRLEAETGLSYDEVKARYSEITGDENQKIRPIEHAADTLRALMMRGSRNYVYTHRGTSTEEVLRNTGLLEYFDDIITSTSGFPRKPDPSGIDHLVGKYGLDKEKTFYVGDRTIDIECAVNAGVKSILFLPEGSYTIPTGKETVIVKDLAEIPSLSL